MALAWDETADKDREAFYVFPLKKDSKIPCIGSAGFNDALSIVDAKSKWPGIMDGNYGIAPGKSDHVVLDIDIKNGSVGADTLESLQKTHGKLPDTFVVKTPSGGFHLYFKRPESLPKIGNIAVGKHIDTRCDAGYVLGVGSEIGSEKYTIFKDDPCAALPKKWIAFIAGIIEGRPAQAEKTTSAPTGTGIIAGDVKEALKHISSDDRDTWLQVTMAIKSTDAGQEAFDLWDAWSKSSDRYNAENNLKTWNSIEVAGGIHVETIFSMAMQNGWSNMPSMPEAVTVNISSDKKKENNVYPPFVYRPVGIGNDIAKYMEGRSIRVQPILAFAASIAVTCTIIGRKYQTTSGLRANIPMIALAGTGMGKEGARTGVKNILMSCQLEEHLGGESIKSGQGLVSAMERQPNSIFLLDEFGRFLKAAGNLKAGSHLSDVITEMMKMYSSSNSVYMGAEYANKKDRPQVKIEYPLCNIYATSTPTSFWESLSSDALVSGELNRFCIFSGSDRPRRQTIKSASVSTSIIEWVNAINNPTYVTGLTGIMPDCPIVVGERADAENILAAYAEKCDAVLFDKAIPEHIKACKNRSHGRACQFAMVFALWENDGTQQPIITAKNATDAVVLVECLDSTLLENIEVYFSQSEFEADMLGLVRAIKALGSDGVQPSRAAKDIKFLRRFRVKERQELINLAGEAGYIVLVKLEGKGNRPIERLIHVDFVKC